MPEGIRTQDRRLAQAAGPTGNFPKKKINIGSSRRRHRPLRDKD
jgi:hypothetical protein